MDQRMKNMTPNATPFNAEQRRKLLDEYFAAQQGLDEVSALIGRSTGTDAQRLMEHEHFYRQQTLAMESQYKAGVPVIELSRCPFTGDVMRHSLDHFGLDGLWWNYEISIRPISPLLKSYVALTGAVKLDGPVLRAPFVCKPGPEVPYVIPRLLTRQEITAVLSSVRIGSNTGYAITYFGNPPPPKIPLINTWGCDTYSYLDEKGDYHWDSEPGSPNDFDFNLEPWISKGRLRWIYPGDTTLTLRKEVSACPYLGLEGRKKSLIIYEGKVH
jgi:hypothetical protein